MGQERLDAETRDVGFHPLRIPQGVTQPGRQLVGTTHTRDGFFHRLEIERPLRLERLEASIQGSVEVAECRLTGHPHTVLSSESSYVCQVIVHRRSATVVTQWR